MHYIKKILKYIFIGIFGLFLLGVILPKKEAKIDMSSKHHVSEKAIHQAIVDTQSKKELENIREQEKVVYTEKIRQEFVEYLRSDSEPTILDAQWYIETLSAGVLDNKTPRDGLAQYICMEINSGRYDGIFGKRNNILIFIKDVRNLNRLGEYDCKKN